MSLLSPFAQKFAADDSAAALEAQDLEDEVCEPEAEELVVDNEDEVLAPEVVASDVAAVRVTEAEANLDGRLPELPAAEVSFSHLASTKVCLATCLWIHV